MKTMLPNNQKNCSFFKAVLVLISFINANAIANNNSDLSTSKVPPILSAKIFSKNAKHARTNLSTVETRKIKAAASVNNLITESTNSTNTTNPAVALDFDGVNDRAIISPVNNMNFSKLTIETWIKSTRNDPAAVEFICSGQNESLEIHLSPNGGLRFIPRPGLYLDAPINTIPQNTWFHLACVYDPATSSARMYINGTSVSLINSTSVPLSSALVGVNTQFNIGVRNTNGDFPFKGQLDEFRVWDKALTQAEIQNSITCGVPSAASNLRLNLPFNQGIATQNNMIINAATDVSGNNNNAILSGFALTGSISNFVEPGGFVPNASTPLFTQIAPICIGETLAPLPTTSTNGIAGSWLPAPNNQATTTYTFTPTTASTCGVVTMTIEVKSIITPYFLQVDPICPSANLQPPLPTTSTNGITGTWSPAINDSATTTYTFTPNQGQCAETTLMTISVFPNSQNSTTVAACGSHTWPLNGQTYTESGTYIITANCITESLFLTINPIPAPPVSTDIQITVVGGCSYLNGSIPLVDVIDGYNYYFGIDSTGQGIYILPYGSGWAIIRRDFEAGIIFTNPNPGVGGFPPPTGWVGQVTSGQSDPGCGTSTLTLTVPNQLIRCAGNTVADLTPAPSSTIKWYSSITSTSPLDASTLLSTGNYYVAAVNSNNCSSARTLIKVTLQQPVVNPTTTATACGSYTWVANSAVYTTSGTYTFTNNCVSNVLNLTINPFPATPYNANIQVNDFNQFCSPETSQFNYNGLLNGKNTYFASYENRFGIAFDGTRWVFYLIPNGFHSNSVYAYNLNISGGTTPPETGWIYTGVSCPNSALTIVSVPKLTFCAGSTVANLTPAPDSIVKWYDSPTSQTALAPTAVLTSGSYYVQSTSAANCATLRVGVAVIVNPILTPTFTQVPAICNNATLAALPTSSLNGVVGTWLPALNNLATTTYTFTPNAGQCATTATMTITVNPILTPTFTQVAAVCAGATLAALPTISLNGIAGTWSPAVNNLATTTYTFTPAAGACATTTTMTVVVKTLPTVSTGPAPTNACAGTNVVLTGSASTVTRGFSGILAPANWNLTTTNQLSAVNTSLAPNSVSIITNSAVGQSEIASYAITIPSTGTITFNWNFNTTAPSAVFNELFMGTISRNVPFAGFSSANGTSQSGVMTISVVAGQNLVFSSATRSTTAGAATVMISNLIYKTGTLSWSTTNGTIVGATDGISATVSTSGTYVLTTTNAEGCSANSDVDVVFNAPVTPTFTQIAPICSGTTLIALPTTSTNGIAGTWSPALNNLVTTTYTFTPNAGLCATTATLTIVVNPSSDNSTTISACTNYVWANTGQTYTQSGVYAGTTTNCVTQKLNLTINTIPVLPTLEQVSCGVGTVTFTSTASGVISWYSSATSTTILATGSSFTTPVLNGSTVYYYQVVSGSCTSIRTPANAIVSQLPEILEVVNASACVPSSLTLEALSNDTAVKWYDAPVGGNLVYEGADFTTPFLSTTTTYYASAVSLYDCPPSARVAITATINNVSAPTAASNQTFCAGEPLSNIAITGSGIVWYDAAIAGTSLPSTTVLQAGTTYYASQTLNGCESINRKAITMTNGACLGNENFDEASFSYYPNPTNGILNVNYSSEIYKVEVTNMLGQNVLVQKTNSEEAQIDLQFLPAGTYLVKISSDDKIKSIKIVKN